MRAKLLFIAVSVALLNTPSLHAVAMQPQKLRCSPVSGEYADIECIYKVAGENPEDPQQASYLYATTDMPYALCSKALCTVSKIDKHLAVCTCPVYGASDKEPRWQRISVGPNPYRFSAPAWHGAHLVTATSTFSMANFTNLARVDQVTCKGKQPLAWANCFGVQCQVHYQDKAGKAVPVATCQCPVVESQVFVAMGPSDANQCTPATGQIWSAATAAQGRNNNSIVTEMISDYGDK